MVGRKKLERAWDGGDSLNPLPEGALWCMPGLLGGVACACESHGVVFWCVCAGYPPTAGPARLGSQRPGLPETLDGAAADWTSFPSCSSCESTVSSQSGMAVEARGTYYPLPFP